MIRHSFWFGLGRWLLALWVSAPTALLAQGVPTSDGLYAVFDTTQGTIVARLRMETAPVTVANFVSLAEGTRAWLDYTTGTARRDPFYDGTFIYRIAPGFIAQGGSRSGSPIEDPGFTFRNEVSQLATHNGPGVLSMVRGTALDTNGAQFFFTLAARPELDWQFSVFGQVVSGIDVLTTWAELPLDENGRANPMPVVRSVRIVRNGAAANAFNPLAQQLPIVRQVQGRLTWLGETATMTGIEATNRQVTLFHTSDLQNWAWFARPLPLNEPAPLVVDVTEAATQNGADRRFFRSVATDYTIWTPPNLDGRRVRLDLGGDQYIILQPSGTAGTFQTGIFAQVNGSFQYLEGGGTLSDILNNQGLHSLGWEGIASTTSGAALRPIWEFSFYFTSATGGSYNGTLTSIDNGLFFSLPIGGTFVVLP